MTWWVIGLEALAFAAIFTAIVFLAYRGDRKYSAAGVYNYPPDIREEYFKTHERMDVSAKSKKVIFTKSLGILALERDAVSGDRVRADPGGGRGAAGFGHPIGGNYGKKRFR